MEFPVVDSINCHYCVSVLCKKDYLIELPMIVKTLRNMKMKMMIVDRGDVNDDDWGPTANNGGHQCGTQLCWEMR